MIKSIEVHDIPNGVVSWTPPHLQRKKNKEKKGRKEV